MSLKLILYSKHLSGRPDFVSTGLTVLLIIKAASWPFFDGPILRSLRDQISILHRIVESLDLIFSHFYSITHQAEFELAAQSQCAFIAYILPEERALA